MELNKTIETYLSTHNIATLSTCVENIPHASTVEYVNNGLVLYFSTNPETQKAKNMEKNNRVSLTIDEDYPDWTKIQGIQMDGIAEEIKDPSELKLASSLYLEKFPFVADFPPSNNKMYKVTPTKIYFLDYTKGFGHRDTIEP